MTQSTLLCIKSPLFTDLGIIFKQNFDCCQYDCILIFCLHFTCCFWKNFKVKIILGNFSDLENTILTTVPAWRDIFYYTILNHCLSHIALSVCNMHTYLIIYRVCLVSSAWCKYNVGSGRVHTPLCFKKYTELVAVCTHYFVLNFMYKDIRHEHKHTNYDYINWCMINVIFMLLKMELSSRARFCWWPLCKSDR